MRHDLIIKSAEQQRTSTNNDAYTVYTVPYKNVTLPVFSFTADNSKEAEDRVEAWRIARGFHKNEVGVRQATSDEKNSILHNEYLN